jgi:hypothetical protein
MSTAVKFEVRSVKGQIEMLKTAAGYCCENCEVLALNEKIMQEASSG